MTATQGRRHVSAIERFERSGRASLSPESTEPSLLSRIRDPRNEVAWREFEGKYRELILRYVRRRGLQPADAEDVRQLVMINLSRYMRDFQYDAGRGRFRSYLGRVVRNAVALHFSRTGAPEVQLDSRVAAALPAAEDSAEDAVWDNEWMNHHYRMALEALRGRIDERSARIFDRLVAGDAVADVARAFQLTSDAVNKVKQRMRERLKRQIADQLREEDGVPT